MQETLIDQGLNLMLFGMGTVFIFLTILVFATTLMSTVVTRFATDDEPTKAQNTAPTLTSLSDHATDPNTLIAIKKAIALHRQR